MSPLAMLAILMAGFVATVCGGGAFGSLAALASERRLYCIVRFACSSCGAAVLGLCGPSAGFASFALLAPATLRCEAGGGGKWLIAARAP
eukprot:10568876-Lingulodinium_polyedra.AAC.1